MNDPVKLRRRSEKEIRRLLTIQEKKDITVSGFCKAHKIHKATFYNWRNKYGLQKDKQQQFVPVQFSDHICESSLFAEIELGPGVTIKLFQKVDASYFKALL